MLSNYRVRRQWPARSPVFKKVDTDLKKENLGFVYRVSQKFERTKNVINVDVDDRKTWSRIVVSTSFHTLTTPLLRKKGCLLTKIFTNATQCVDKGHQVQPILQSASTFASQMMEGRMKILFCC